MGATGSCRLTSMAFTDWGVKVRFGETKGKLQSILRRPETGEPFCGMQHHHTSNSNGAYESSLPGVSVPYLSTLGYFTYLSCRVVGKLRRFGVLDSEVWIRCCIRSVSDTTWKDSMWYRSQSFHVVQESGSHISLSHRWSSSETRGIMETYIHYLGPQVMVVNESFLSVWQFQNLENYLAHRKSFDIQASHQLVYSTGILYRTLLVHIVYINQHNAPGPVLPAYG